jgi:hypothetical protein
MLPSTLNTDGSRPYVTKSLNSPENPSKFRDSSEMKTVPDTVFIHVDGTDHGP